MERAQVKRWRGQMGPHEEREYRVGIVAAAVLPHLELSGWFAGGGYEESVKGAFKIAESFVVELERREALARQMDEEET